MAGGSSVEVGVTGSDAVVVDAVVPDAVAAPAGAFRAWLAEVDVRRMSDQQRVDLIAELERVKGSVSAAQARATDALRCSSEAHAPRDAGRSVGSQVALARRESPTLGDRFVGMSRALVHEMPHTMAALTDGVVGERHALAMVAGTATLSRDDRGEVDRRLAAVLGRLGVRGVERAAARVAAELDAASVVAQMEAAVRSRRVTVRPAPNGMAYLTVLGPLKDVVGAHAALLRRSRTVVGGQCPEEAPEGRGVGAVAADTALRLLSGRAVGQAQPVEVHLVMSDRALLGAGDPRRSALEPARVPGHGSVPAPVARAWVRDADEGSVWLRRLFTSPSGRDLVAMDSRRRIFPAPLRRMLVLRDDVCTTPWCGAPVVQADHTHPARDGGVTSMVNGDGKCARCNHVKEAPGWSVEVIHPGDRRAQGVLRKRRPARRTRHRPRRRAPARERPREVEVRTPTGHRYRSEAPPLLGWGGESLGLRKRPLLDSRLERHLVDLLAAA